MPGGIMISIKRVYQAASPSDGTRFLVDHLWPRGLKKEGVKMKSWLKAVSPSDELRHWFGHEPVKRTDFQRRYFAELDKKPESWQPLLQAAQEGDITLVFSAREAEPNNAVALKNYLDKRLRAKGSDRQSLRMAA